MRSGGTARPRPAPVASLERGGGGGAGASGRGPRDGKRAESRRAEARGREGGRRTTEYGLQRQLRAIERKKLRAHHFRFPPVTRPARRSCAVGVLAPFSSAGACKPDFFSPDWSHRCHSYRIFEFLKMKENTAEWYQHHTSTSAFSFPTNRRPRTRTKNRRSEVARRAESQNQTANECLE